MIDAYALLLLGAVALFFYIREKLKAYTVKAVLWKAFVSTLFLTLAVDGWYTSGSQNIFGAFIVLGLICGLLGDIWLDLKYVYPQHDDPYTYAGFASFAIGHVLFITGMISKSCSRAI